MEGYCSTGESPQRAVVPIEEEEEEEEEGEEEVNTDKFTIQQSMYSFYWLLRVSVLSLSSGSLHHHFIETYSNK
jgi:hypothetical protein